MIVSETVASPSVVMIREASDGMDKDSPTKSLEVTLVKLATAICLELALVRLAIESPQKQELRMKQQR